MNEISLTEVSLLLVMSASALILLSMAYDAWRLEITPTPSSRRAREEMIKACGKQLTSTNYQEVTIHELGFGWGGLLFELSQRRLTEGWSSVTSVQGYELAILPYLWLTLRLWLMRLWLMRLWLRLRMSHRSNSEEIQLYRSDCLQAFERAKAGDVLVCYLCPAQMKRIADHLRRHQPEAELYLISLTFALPGHEPIERSTVNNLYGDPIYTYRLSSGSSVK